jgi:hypothetical protein
MTTLREAAQAALEALENCTSEHGHRCNRCDSEVGEGGQVVAALRAALAQPEPRNQCGETCERAKLCAVCARGLEQEQEETCKKFLQVEEQEQEPVAWLYRHKTEPWKQATMVQRMDRHLRGSDEWHEVPLYTHPPRREWQSLTDEEIGMLYVTWDATPGVSMADFARAIEAKLKEINHG